MFKIAVFVSGRGSNLQAILDKIKDGFLQIEIKFVVSDKFDCPAFNVAANHNIKTLTISTTAEENCIDYYKLNDLFNQEKIDLIVLAGFLKMIPEFLIKNFENKIINIHPALLPSFGGKNMYGMNVHKSVYEHSCKVSGATVHFVNNEYDKGKIIFQKCVDISGANSPEEIAAYVLKIEHEILPITIKKFSENKVILLKDRVNILT